jgi:hypothetical protein
MGGVADDVTDADAVVLILPASLLPSDLDRIVGVPRALIRELDALRERRYYEPFEPEFSDEGISRMAALVGVRSVTLQPDIDWLQVIDGDMPQPILDNLMRRQQGLAISPSDLADPELAPLLADPRLSFWDLRADGLVRIVNPTPDPMPDSVSFSDLPDTAVIAVMAADTDLFQVPTERIFTAGGVRLWNNGDSAGVGQRGPDDILRRTLAEAAVQTIGVSHSASVRSINYIHIDIATGTVEAQPGGGRQPLGDRVLLFRAESLRDARLSAMRASTDLKFFYLAFGRTIPVDAAGDARQRAMDAHRIERARIVAEEGGVVALPANETDPTAFLYLYQDRTAIYVGRLPDGRWHFSGLQSGISPQDAGGRFQDVIVGGFDAAKLFESIVAREDEVAAAFQRDDAAFLVTTSNRATDVDLALSRVTDPLFDGSHMFISVSRGVPVEIAPLP